MASRLLLYGTTSTALAAAVISSALNSRPNFFSAAVSVGRSSGSLIVLANFVLFNVICFGIVVKTVFFGQLRAIEYEHLFERLWLFLTESLLALTIFRDDFSVSFAILYGILLFLKCFHWITADRVDYMDQIPPPGPPRLFHLRLSSILLILVLADFTLVNHCCESILEHGVSSKVLFASEFMILLASIGGTVLRYYIGTVDIRRARGRDDAPAWEEKSMWLFYVDLGVDFVKLLTYLGFFTIILLHYGVPLHILREVYMTLKSFLSRCADLVRYRRATRDMDALYPSATGEEMERLGDKTCIICREEMVVAGTGAGVGSGEEAVVGGGSGSAAGGGGVAAGSGSGNGQNDVGPNETPKKLACGHVFHFHCLRSWLERQQKCPTCRRDVLVTPPPPARTGAAQAPQPQSPAPAAAPGAVPIPPQAAPLNPIQTVYNEYFRQQPPRPPQHAPSPIPQAVEEDRRIQTGIWGGPITPGTFFATPLGAAPRSAGMGSGVGTLSVPLAGPSRLRIPRRHDTDTPRPTVAASVPTSATPRTQPLQPELPRPEVSVPQFTPTLPSGSTTPYSSNPPQVFTSTGTSRDDEEEEEGSEGYARKQAGEAAMRRLGLGITAANLPVEATGRHALISPPPQRVIDLTEEDGGELTGGRINKGKGKAEVGNGNGARAYLSGLHEPEGEKLDVGDVSAGEVRERMRVLMDVEERIWGVMEDLMSISGTDRGRGSGTVPHDQEGPSGTSDTGGLDGLGGSS